ncbi:riboflavin kinase [Neobacillus sp. NPDC093182]|uniref:riboflavin kinase n=1 Tax=Neobacillus sp. NPDC093182 TaxID=3364297 RepID=UPI0038007617
MIVIDSYKEMIIKGQVVKGRQVDRKIGFPTANLGVSSNVESFLQRGVYGVNVYHGNFSYNGVMNIGVRPTFKDKRPSVSCEVKKQLNKFWQKEIEINEKAV